MHTRTPRFQLIMSSNATKATKALETQFTYPQYSTNEFTKSYYILYVHRLRECNIQNKFVIIYP